MHFTRSQAIMLLIIFVLYTVVAVFGAHIYGANREFAGYNMGMQRGVQKAAFITEYAKGGTPICVEGFNVWQATRTRKNVFVTKALASQPLPMGGD